MHPAIFSLTYGKAIHGKLREILCSDKTKTYFFTVNTGEIVEELEKVADNLMFSRMEKSMKLYLRIERMKWTPFRRSEVEVSISKEILEEIRNEAEK
ncbi:hypothetical protein [Thermococcus sp.]